MSKATDNTMFVSTWNDIVSGYDYKVEIMPVATTDFALAKTVTLPENFIQSLYFDFGDDEYGIDLTLPVMNVTIDCLSYYNTGTDDDIFDVLFYPFLDLTYDYNSVTKIVASGNIFKFYVKFNGDDTVNEPAPNDYRLMFTGIQKKGIETGYKHKDFLLELEIHDAGKCITESVDMQYLHYFFLDSVYWSDIINKKQFFDYVNEPIVGKYPFYQAYTPAGTNTADKEKKNFWFISWQKHIEILESFALTVAKKVLRDSTIATFNIDLPIPKLYKQEYLNTGSVTTTTALTSDEVYLPVLITDYVASAMNFSAIALGASYTIYGGAYYNDISKDYKYLWDYLSDYYKQNLKRAYFSPDLSVGFYWKNLLTANDDTLTVSQNDNNAVIIIDDAPTLFADVLQRVSVAHVKAKNKDVKEYEIVINSSRSDKNKSIPLIHNNTPNAPESFALGMQTESRDSIFKGSTRFEINITYTKGCVIAYQSYGADFKGFYYLDNPVSVEFTPATHFTASQFIRCNEYAILLIGDSITSENYFTKVEMNFVKYLQNTYNDVSESIYVQNNSGIAKAIAESMIGMFSDNLQSKFTFNTSIRTGTEYLAGGSRGCLWFNPYATTINFDANEYAPDTKPTLFADYPVNYNLIKGKIHIKDSSDTGTVTITVLGNKYKPSIPAP